jgi:membrane-bound inhibitor of C-type lysozyme
MHRPTLAAALAALALPAAAQPVPEGFSASYACAGGATVEAAYLNAPEASYAVVLHDGRLVPLKAGPTGSGVRYVSLPGIEPPLVWHTKGADAFLARDDAGETMLAEDCRTGDLP